MGGDESDELPEGVREEMGGAIVEAQKLLKSSASPGSALPAVKDAFKKCAERSTKLKERLNAVINKTKGAKEQMLAEAFVAAGNKDLDELEALILEINTVELPYLKGIEVS